ncbi:Os07g0235400 [Oryza sativa Japonica Group]|uniref:Os07g0235400 protein n=1 Tax=Oryza sativa subsp. japonica TaxID=39947 RepID=A0A0P0X3Y9_ORYSJ|nr:Os07g0235400 [Oryza sativa Japonica Group]
MAKRGEVASEPSRASPPRAPRNRRRERGRGEAAGGKCGLDEGVRSESSTGVAMPWGTSTVRATSRWRASAAVVGWAPAERRDWAWRRRDSVSTISL